MTFFASGCDKEVAKLPMPAWHTITHVHKAPLAAGNNDMANTLADALTEIAQPAQFAHTTFQLLIHVPGAERISSCIVTRRCQHILLVLSSPANAACLVNTSYLLQIEALSVLLRLDKYENTEYNHSNTLFRP